MSQINFRGKLWHRCIILKKKIHCDKIMYTVGWSETLFDISGRCRGKYVYGSDDDVYKI